MGEDEENCIKIECKEEKGEEIGRLWEEGVYGDEILKMVKKKEKNGCAFEVGVGFCEVGCMMKMKKTVFVKKMETFGCFWKPLEWDCGSFYSR